MRQVLQFAVSGSALWSIYHRRRHLLETSFTPEFWLKSRVPDLFAINCTMSVATFVFETANSLSLCVAPR